jgi:hypothetical protein
MLQKLLVAVVGPHRLSRVYLADQLAYFGVERGRIPNACLQELADDCMKSVRFAAKAMHRKRREVAIEYLEDRAADISCILDGIDPFDTRTEQYDERVEAILLKHGILIDHGFLPFRLREARRYRSPTGRAAR